jgi:cyanoexosortase B-associated protein
MSSLTKILSKNNFSQISILFLLIFLLVIGTVPGYITGKWQWQQPPSVSQLKELKNLRHVGLNIPGWQTIEQKEKEIGQHKWSVQVVKKEGKKTLGIIMLLPQNGPKDQPQVEWTDINGLWHWQIAQDRLARLSIKPEKGQKIDLQAKFFRASTDEQTFAVLQWYAWKNGGHPSPWNWFAVDQKAQWQRQRAAWVAVSIVLPMEPRGQVEKYWDEMRSLAEQVQIALLPRL